MRFRDANESDYEACLPLLQQLWLFSKISGADVEPKILQEIKEVFYRLLRDPDAKVILAESGRQIIGFLDLTFRKTLFYRGWAMLIEDLNVDENYRRIGIGSQLVRLAEDIAQQRGCHGIELNSDLYRKETHHFWEALGFECKAYQFRKALK
ncbi:MAG: GNAT family N-acetyltransferase [Promethearchaeota archaeon]